MGSTFDNSFLKTLFHSGTFCITAFYISSALFVELGLIITPLAVLSSRVTITLDNNCHHAITARGKRLHGMPIKFSNKDANKTPQMYKQ